ncbi:Gfo/Idh/MocA family oxidoreductase [Salmonella enterica subsp. enterica]|nr:gfo/Idh/MocA family oxidoreductase [Salmonella enterica]EBY0806091.1 gfo/Idh/MocA family oxidoreductase [Salmonella enterica subsp. enterica serovar Berlin]ECF3780000.1 Gfo/Idh/MocA family oxidoreductase [Salmonella enterica subsp. enterica serovar Oslo]EDR2104882.1 Gfo/Idh/MocA family oxidoreductase [Salmonella enterica subsp. enterica]EDW0612926.1 Gfo/Idh/MocA family oxidoreductase [Salmonella enterica subsp. enterica serovar Ball]EGZ4376742.1 Gfo/Idh/MocA family oxidoreductase [Salmonell
MNNFAENSVIKKRIRLGMVGGGEGAFIGEVHRMAARLSDRFELVAGAFSSTPEKSISSGLNLGLSKERCYASYTEMVQQEMLRDDGIDAVAIVTPNHMHYPVAKLFLENGIHVICDKPLTSTLDDAYELKKIADNSNCLFIITYNYNAYPMVREAKDIIERGELGEIRLVLVEYAQDWLSDSIEMSGSKQAIWRTDPEKSGAGGATGDIGTHAYNLACFITGLEVDEISADVTTFVPGRRVDDNACVWLRFTPSERGHNVKGTLWCSQVAIGNENGLRIRIYGSHGGLEWSQENPNHLYFQKRGQPSLCLTRGGAGISDAARSVTRIPAGHPEGYLEAFATIYEEAAEAIIAYSRHHPLEDFPHADINDGLKGIIFIDACIKSSKQNGEWIKV